VIGAIEADIKLSPFHSMVYGVPTETLNDRGGYGARITSAGHA
jgi:hypothetical protein